MNGRERLLKTLNGERTDRVPISLYEFDGFYGSSFFERNKELGEEGIRNIIHYIDCGVKYGKL